jgi:hypothetical protein
MCAEAGRDGVGARRLDHNELVNGGTDGQSRSIKHLTVKVIIAETTSETITKMRWGWPLLVAAASINCIRRLTMVPVQGDAVKGARPRLPADEGSHEVAPGPIRLTKRCAPEAMPAMSPCSARGLRNECRGSNLVDYRMLTPPAHPMNDGLSLYPQAGAVSCEPPAPNC